MPQIHRCFGLLLKTVSVLWLCASLCLTSRAQDEGKDKPVDNSAPLKLEPGDIVQLRVFKEPDLDSEAKVSSEGEANLPLIGYVNIGGKTLKDAESLIRERYDKDYLVSPQVMLTLLRRPATKDEAVVKRVFYVMGQVTKPGALEMVEGQQLTLLQAIALAGGFTRIADPKNVKVTRKENGKEIVIPLDAKAMVRDANSSKFIVRPDDFIQVGESVF